MISIIICSRAADISQALKDNISQTVGCENELVIIDNSTNSYSIFQAYNEGVSRARGNILCFMHEDVRHHTEGWGRIISGEFLDPTVGLIGVAGTHFIPKVPMYWYESPFISQYSMNNDGSGGTMNDTCDNFKGVLADVVAVDGMCFFIRTELFDKIRFDDQSFTGFHAYDMDICMQVHDIGKRVCVTREILVEHFWSELSLNNRKYIEQLDRNMVVFSRKWQDRLPMVRGVELPQIVWLRLNNLCARAYEAKAVRRSKAYRLGRLILSPLKWIKNCFRHR